MKKVTGEFIKERGKHCISNLVVVNKVEKIEGGISNKCFENAVKFANDGKLIGVKYLVLCGWIIQPFDQKNNCTSIIQHWWNGDEEGIQFDTTPNIGNDSEYVLDFDLRKFTITNYDKIFSNVAMSILYSDGQYELLVDPEKMIFERINQLRTDLLFHYL